MARTKKTSSNALAATTAFEQPVPEADALASGSGVATQAQPVQPRVRNSAPSADDAPASGSESDSDDAMETQPVEPRVKNSASSRAGLVFSVSRVRSNMKRGMDKFLSKIFLLYEPKSLPERQARFTFYSLVNDHFVMTSSPFRSFGGKSVVSS